MQEPEPQWACARAQRRKRRHGRDAKHAMSPLMDAHSMHEESGEQVDHESCADPPLLVGQDAVLLTLSSINDMAADFLASGSRDDARLVGAILEEKIKGDAHDG